MAMDDGEKIVPVGETFGSAAAHAGYSDVDSLGLQNDEALNQEPDRGIDLIGGTKDELNKKYNDKLSQVDKALAESNDWRNDAKREGILKADNEFPVLMELREEVTRLFDKMTSNDSSTDDVANWYEVSLKRDAMERAMIEKSESPISEEIKRIEALREYREYLLKKKDDLIDQTMK